MRDPHTPTVLTLAGMDPSGGAGITMDLRVIHALGGYGLSVATALTVQDTRGVHESQPVDPDLLYRQADALLRDIAVDAVKIGMLATEATIDAVVALLETHRPPHVILDPVLVSSSGHPLLEPQAADRLRERLFPLCELITPNLPEAIALSGDTLHASASAETIARTLHRRFLPAILLKGGHAPTPDRAADLLIDADGTLHRWEAQRIITRHTHGTGCLLSSAIALFRARGLPLPESIAQAKAFLTRSLHDAHRLRLRYRDPALARTEPIPLFGS